jgi:hypothetical protein
MACPVPRSTPTTGAARSAAGHDITLITDASPAAEDFEFCVLSSGGLALAGDDAADVCVADEVFSGGKLLPLSLCSASALLLLRSDTDSLDGATSTAASTSGGFSSRSSSRGASSSSSSCVSRSTSSKSSASSDPASLRSLFSKSAASLDATKQPPRRPPSSSVFYAHPSPSPRPPRSAASAARRSTGSAPPASWGLIRLGVVGAPEVYPRRAPAAARSGISHISRFEQASAGATKKEAVHLLDRKLGLGLLLGAGLVCSCSPDAVAPVGTAEAAAAEARRRRKKADERKKPGKQSGQSISRRSRRILDWLEELSTPRTNKNVA